MADRPVMFASQDEFLENLRAGIIVHDMMRGDGYVTNYEQVERGICLLMYVENHMHQHLMVEIYGEELGAHLWNKFTACMIARPDGTNHRDVLSFYNGLDIGNKRRLINWYNQRNAAK